MTGAYNQVINRRSENTEYATDIDIWLMEMQAYLFYQQLALFGSYFGKGLG